MKAAKKEVKREIKLVEQFLDFGIISILGAGMQLGLMYLFTQYLNVYYLISAAIAFVLTSTYSFLTTKHFTFHSRAGYFVCEERFFVVSIISLALNIILLYLLTKIMNIYYIFAQAIAGVILFTSIFFVHKYWTFRK